MNVSFNTISQNAYNTVRTLIPQSSYDVAALTLIFASTYFSKEAALVEGACYVGYKWYSSRQLSDPSKVSNIYLPEHNDTLTVLQDKIDIFREKVEILKNDPNVIGIVSLPRVDLPGQTSPVYIKKDYADKNTEHLVARDIETNQKVGFALLHPSWEKNNYMKSYYCFSDVPEYLQGYGADKTDVPKIYLEQVTNEQPQKFKNVGVILIKAILQHYQTSCDARLIFNAVRNTQPYYYKMGFRMVNNDVESNRRWAEIAASGRKTYVDMGSHPMLLPDDARKLWKDEIAANPIGFPKRIEKQGP
jgi:hypothetical protein